MADQAHELRKRAWERKRSATYLSVSSGKGGVGKTNFVVNLAYQLAALGKKVLVFDADLGLANVDILLSLSVTTSIRKYLTGEASVEDVIKRNVYGFDVFPASSGFIELTELSEDDYQRITDVFIALDTKYDYIIFDTGAGISESVIRFAAMADRVIVITQPEPTAITDAYAFMKVVSQTYKIRKIYFLLNRVDDPNGVNSIFESMKGVAGKFLGLELELLGFMREDKLLRKAIRAQKPVSETEPKADYVKDVQNVARRLLGLPVDASRAGNNIYSLIKGVFK